MKWLSYASTVALASSGVGLVQLVWMNFPSGVVALNTSTRDISIYKGAYGLGRVNNILDEMGEVKGLQFEMEGVSASAISLALDSSAEVQGTQVIIRTAIIDLTTYAVIESIDEWSGYLDTMTISEDGNTAAISVTAESGAVDLLRGNPATYSDADQRAVYAGDRAFEYVVDQVDKPLIWPSKEYFFK